MNSVNPRVSLRSKLEGFTYGTLYLLQTEEITALEAMHRILNEVEEAYAGYVEDSQYLFRLLEAGVDNWEGYDAVYSSDGEE